jgi:hypothetical protein
MTLMGRLILVEEASDRRHLRTRALPPELRACR